MGINIKEMETTSADIFHENLLRRARIIRGCTTISELFEICYIINISERSGNISITAEGKRINVEITPDHVCAEIDAPFGDVHINGKICAEFENGHGKLVANGTVTYLGIEIEINDLIIITW